MRFNRAIRITYKILERNVWRTSHSLDVDPSDPSEVERVAVTFEIALIYCESTIWSTLGEQTRQDRDSTGPVSMDICIMLVESMVLQPLHACRCAFPQAW